MMVFHFVSVHELLPLIDQSKFVNFLNGVVKLYRPWVQYHNDLHGVDVANQCHMALLNGFKETFKLSQTDTFALLIASCAHDLDHDGFTNAYHKTQQT